MADPRDKDVLNRPHPRFIIIPKERPPIPAPTRSRPAGREARRVPQANNKKYDEIKARRNLIHYYQDTIRRRYIGFIDGTPDVLKLSSYPNFHILSDFDFDQAAKRYIRKTKDKVEVSDLMGFHDTVQRGRTSSTHKVYLRHHPKEEHQFHVTAVHEILHGLNRLKSGMTSLEEGATQYLAIYAVDGVVTNTAINEKDAIYSTETYKLHELILASKLSDMLVADAYLRRGLEPLKMAVNSALGNENGWDVIISCYDGGWIGDNANAPIITKEVNERWGGNYDVLFYKLLDKTFRIISDKGRPKIELTPKP